MMDANSKLKKTDAVVNPVNIYPASGQRPQIFGTLRKDKEIDRLVQVVDFDVAVQVDESKGTKGGIGIVVAGLALGSQGQSASGQTSQSRIKFSVPMMFPQGK